MFRDSVVRIQLNWDDPWHATLWAVCLVAFFGLLRNANLLCKGSTQFNPSKHLRRRDIIFFARWSADGPRQSNLASAFRQSLYLASTSIRCPYTALKHAFNLVPAPLSGPVFVVPAPRGLIPLTYGKFDSMLKSLAAAINLDPSQISASLGQCNK